MKGVDTVAENKANATKQERRVRKIERSAVAVNTLIGDLMSNISKSGNYDSERNRELEEIFKQANDIINDEVESIKNKTGEDITKFYYDLYKREEANIANDMMSIEKIFGSNKEAMYATVMAASKNRDIYYDRLGMLASQLFELEEAINTTRDSITTGDDVSNRISRTISFVNGSPDDDIIKSATDAIVKMERDNKMLHKIKAFIVPKTLTLGNFFAITMPYSYIFNKAAFEKIKNGAANKVSRHTVKGVFGESAIFESIDLSKDKNVISIFESVAGSGSTKELKTELANNINIIIDDDISPVLFETINGLMESSDLPDASLSGDSFDRVIKASIKKNTSGSGAVFNDGTIDISKDDVFKDVTGCYTKLVDPRRLKPIFGLDDNVLGYIYIHTPMGPECGNASGTNIFTKIAPDINTMDRNYIVGQMSDRIYKAFSKKFVMDHIKFKDTIAQALLYNDLYTKHTTFQFIPVDYVTHFKIDEDMDGFGTSMLARSMFKAQLYLGFFIFKYMSAIDRSNDTRIHYIKSSKLDKKFTRRVQRTMREVANRTPSFSKFSTYGGMMDVVNVANRDIFMPVGESEVRGIDFDVLSGQDVQMENEFMTNMRNDYINGTGVPSVIMNYVNEADYAKTLVMANSKFLNRVISYQLDLNDGITEWYKKLIKFSGIRLKSGELSETHELVDRFEFKFNQPKMLNFTNMGDLLSNADQVLAFITKAQTGENADQTQDSNIIKDHFYLAMAQDFLPMLPWSRIQDVYNDAKVKAIKQSMETTPEE